MATKAATKKAAPKPKAESAEKVDRGLLGPVDTKLGKLIVSQRDKDNLGWAAIAEDHDISSSQAMFLYLRMTVDPIEAVGANLEKAVVKARDKEAQSWGVISARTSRTEGWCRKVYQEHTGTAARGHRIGKGGRYPAEAARPEPAVKAPKAAAKKAAAPTKKAAAKKAPAKKAAVAKTKASPLASMDVDALRTRLEGERITLQDGEVIQIQEITGLDEGVVTVVDDEGDIVPVEISEIKSASKSG